MSKKIELEYKFEVNIFGMPYKIGGIFKENNIIEEYITIRFTDIDVIDRDSLLNKIKELCEVHEKTIK